MQVSQPACRRRANYCSPEAQPTQPSGPGAPPAGPSFRHAGCRVPQCRVPRARASPGRGGGGSSCTHHSGPSSPAQNAGADGADLGLGFHINSFLPGASFSGLPFLRLLPVLLRLSLAWSPRVSLSSSLGFSSLGLRLLHLLRLHKKNGKCKSPHALGRRRLSAECSADSQLRACFY